MKEYTYTEKEITKLIDYQVKVAKRFFRFIITNDNDDSYIPKLKSDFVICDCSNGEDFTLGRTWKKYFDECDGRPVLFINTSAMFQQFEEKDGIDGVRLGFKGSALWAQYFYERYRDKMWKEQRTKFLFMVKDEDMTEMYRKVPHGFFTELVYYPMIKDELSIERDEIVEESSTNTQEQSGPVLTKRLTPPKHTGNK